MRKKELKIYKMPLIFIREVRVEYGFTTSGNAGSSDVEDMGGESRENSLNDNTY